MSLPRPLENNNQHTLTLSQTCPVQADHLTTYAFKAASEEYDTKHGKRKGMSSAEIRKQMVKHIPNLQKALGAKTRRRKVQKERMASRKRKSKGGKTT